VDQEGFTASGGVVLRQVVVIGTGDDSENTPHQMRPGILRIRVVIASRAKYVEQQRT